MNDDPDVPAMANSPIRNDDYSNVEMRDTTVIQGGASGGLFMPDVDSDEEDVRRVQRRAEGVPEDDGGYDTDAYFQTQLMDTMADSDEDEEDDDAGQEDLEDEDEDEDPIVKTYDIYGTKRLAEHLYLFQYPIRPPNRPYEDPERPTGARMKPRCGHLEVEIPIPDSTYYDKERGRKWTDEALRQQTIGGTVMKGRNYVIGVMQGDELHVTSLKGTVQLRPNFTYIDAYDSAEKESKRPDAISERAPRTAKAIQVSAKSSDAVADLSTTALIRAAEEENWTKLQWKDSDDRESRKLCGHMFTNKTRQICESLTDKTAYLGMLSSGKQDESKITKITKAKKEG